MTAPPVTPWLAFVRASPALRLRLFCLPYAGGSAIGYRALAAELPPEIEVCPVELPGHGTRLREPPATHLAEVVPALANAILAWVEQPFALFGHSMGALLAFELARELRRAGRAPMLLAVSSLRAPHLRDRHGSTHDLPTRELLAKVQRLDGTPAEVWSEPDLVSAIVPTLRADFRICDTYVFRREPPLPAPLRVFGGDRDPVVSREELAAWREHTSGKFSVEVFRGGHFYFKDDVRTLASQLGRWLLG